MALVKVHNFQRISKETSVQEHYIQHDRYACKEQTAFNTENTYDNVSQYHIDRHLFKRKYCIQCFIFV